MGGATLGAPGTPGAAPDGADAGRADADTDAGSADAINADAGPADAKTLDGSTDAGIGAAAGADGGPADAGAADAASADTADAGADSADTDNARADSAAPHTGSNASAVRAINRPGEKLGTVGSYMKEDSGVLRRQIGRRFPRRREPIPGAVASTPITSAVQIPTNTVSMSHVWRG